ncbi:hypothetical protein DWZ09_24955 [Bacteroides cellulosilyticus]|uniref:AAA family ATPase n=1 Tax=Bacteroides cellulosilyticus TaxID=246787 RepID=UPI000E4F93F6|nr:AAA family ATPase [Bacteroides cellulosilyticus]RGQ09138.1 hypothetical protein DWZ09_24955 [Bacteroides cellulosilyticus]
MIYISKFRSNDLNPSKGKQIEFNKGVVDKFFNFTGSEHIVDFECHSVLNPNLKEDIHVEFKLSPSRGDYKIYQNSDGTKDLKDFFLDTLHLESDKNLDDYFAIKKKNSTKYILYYLPKDIIFSNFFSIAANDQILFISEKSDGVKNEESDIPKSRQIIYYGAPGTGKSHKIKEALGEYEDCPADKKVPKVNIFRTTFHPDSDYSTFVGAYKPTKGKRPLYGLFGKDTVRMKDGEDLFEDMITYKFVPQAFLNAYIRAYQTDENVYLIIEEINRGNCAQIFGDLFQLLDRDENGISEYTIKADADLKSFLEEELGEDNPDIKDGELCLPSNLYIYATMNTSDQSLFPIDSAFKRRWDWEYEPIKYKNTDWKIVIDGTEYSWVSLQRKVNDKILSATSSEDKMLGDYFVNPSDGIITDKVLLNKILFYLWNDVCKDGEGDIFRTKEGDKEADITFSDLYGTDKSDKLKAMMNYLQVDVAEYEGGKDMEQENLVDSASKIEVNGKSVKYINVIPYMAIKEYVSLHPEKTTQEILDIWSPFKKYSMRSWVVCNKQERDSMKPEYANYSLEINCTDGQSIWVNKDGWMHNPTKQRDTISEFIDAVNESGLGINITETFI